MKTRIYAAPAVKGLSDKLAILAQFAKFDHPFAAIFNDILIEYKHNKLQINGLLL